MNVYLKELLDYFNGDDLAASSFMSKYAATPEETPYDMHVRMATEFTKYVYTGDDVFSKDETERFFQIFNLFDNFQYIIPGGSVMATLGTDKVSSLSNCYVLPSPKDSYVEIMKTRMDQVNLMCRRGGVGFSISTLRPKGTPVKNAAKTSSGMASFMEGFSLITQEVAQNGRRGALLLSGSIKHPDILDFITMKQDLKKVTGANVSVEITDDFMKALYDEDHTFIQHFPTDPLQKSKLNITKTVDAKEIWDILITCAHKTAEPGIMFMDTMHDYAPDGVYEKFKTISTNPCQPGWATVLTPQGIKTFNDIKIGDSIWSETGWTTIINKTNSGIKDVYDYRTSRNIFIGTENHKVVDNGIKIQVKDAKNIDSLKRRRNNNLIINNQDIMDGLVLGDGSVHKASNNLVFLCIGQNDQDYFKSEINDLIIEHRKKLKKTAYTIKTTITNDELPLTFNREIPDRFFSGNDEKICGFLRGLFSANGSIVDNRITLKTSSPKLRDQVQLMLSSIGISSYFTTNKKKKVQFENGEYECKESYNINITTDRLQFSELIGFIQEYKMNKLNYIVDNVKISNKKEINLIKSIKLISTEEVFDITVDNNTHTYWSGGCNVSNCGEIGMGEYDSCRLIHLNLYSIVKNPFTKDACIDWELLEKLTRQLYYLADALVDLETIYVQRIIDEVDSPEAKELWNKVKNTALEGRRCGIGFTALGDMLAALGLPYNSPEVITKVMYKIFMTQLWANIDLAKALGPFPAWDKDKEFYFNDDEIYGKNDFYQFIANIDQTIADDLYTYGRRNISWSTVKLAA